MIENLNIDFVDAMKLYGAAVRIEGVTTEVAKEAARGKAGKKRSYSHWKKMGVAYTREMGLEWALTEVNNSRGSELPGMVNIHVLSQLYRQLSKNWEKMAGEHVKCVLAACDNFLEEVLTYATPEQGQEIAKKLRGRRIVKHMDAASDAAFAVLGQIAADERNLPKTYSKGLLDGVLHARNKKAMAVIGKLVGQQNDAFHGGYRAAEQRQAVDMQSVESGAIQAYKQMDPDDVAADETLVYVSAYFHTALDFWIDAVTKQVIERSIVKDIPDIISVEWVTNMKEVELKKIAAESEAIQAKRSGLVATVEKMTNGLEKFSDELAGLYDPLPSY